MNMLDVSGNDHLLISYLLTLKKLNYLILNIIAKTLIRRYSEA